MTKHWFIAHLIKKYTNGKKLGLDVGIGQDNWSEFKNCKMIGIDKNTDSKSNVLIELEKPLPFKDNIFDVVIAINSLNYVQNARQLFNEINRVMKNGSIIVCVIDNEKSKNEPFVWEQKYLNRILEVTGFERILSKNFRDNFYAKWYNKTSVYGFSVAKKIVAKENHKLCFKCGKSLGKKFNIDTSTGKLYHQSCLEKKVIKKIIRGHNIKTTHPFY